MDVRRFTLEAGFETHWNEEQGVVEYFPHISLNDGRADWLLWVSSEPNYDYQNALWVAEERLTTKLSNLFKAEER